LTKCDVDETCKSVEWIVDSNALKPTCRMWKMRGLVGLHQPTVYPDITADCYSKKDDPKSSLHWFSKKEGYCTEDYMKRIDS